jgi:hypothetical protein
MHVNSADPKSEVTMLHGGTDRYVQISSGNQLRCVGGFNSSSDAGGMNPHHVAPLARQIAGDRRVIIKCGSFSARHLQQHGASRTGYAPS